MNHTEVMNLAFSTTWKSTMPEHMAGNPTFFVEKIFEGMNDYKISDYFQSHESIDLCLKKNVLSENFLTTKYQPKIHTIREDKTNRWGEGNKIHFYINQRTPYQFQFAPVVEVQCVQEIEIVNSYYTTHESGKRTLLYRFVKIDGQPFYSWHDIYEDDNIDKGMLQFAKNDGFDSIEDFFHWFNGNNFKGKIIHWTDKTYQ